MLLRGCLRIGVVLVLGRVECVLGCLEWEGKCMERLGVLFFFLGRDGGSRVPIKIDWHVFCCDGCDASVKFWAFLRGEKKT
jgi:hypothetical protein